MLDPGLYVEKLITLEEVFAGQKIDQGGHWKKQPLSPDAGDFANRLRQRFGEVTRIVDQGSGTGEHTMQLALNHGLEIVGVEITESGVAIARKLAAQEGLLGNGVEFIRGNMLEHTFPDGSFQGFHDFCALCHLHYKDWPQYFKEAARVTVPGALGLLVDFSGYDDNFYGVPIRNQDIGWLEFKGGYVNLQTRGGRRMRQLHNYPEKYENFNWWFSTLEDIQAAARDFFRVVYGYAWDHPEPNKPGQTGQRYYLNVLLERV